MGQFKHPNVVTMYGVVVQGKPVSPPSRPPPPPRPPTVKQFKYNCMVFQVGCPWLLE